MKTNFPYPAEMAAKTGVLLVNLGTPDAPTRAAVYRYLKEFLLDPRVIDINPLARHLLVCGIIAPFRSGKSALAYRKLWTESGSPLKYYGERLAVRVQKLLGEAYRVELAMRYQNPSIQSALARLQEQAVGKIVVFPLFPQYAGATTGSVYAEVLRILRVQPNIPALSLVPAYPTEAAMIRVFAANARQFNLEQYDHFLFSYHGLPQRQLRKADAFGHCLQRADCCARLTPVNQFCYSAQCHATTAALAAELGIRREQYTICFQSRLGRDPWTQPYTARVIGQLAEQGAKRLLVFCPAFTSDCLETTVEIGAEYRQDFLRLGGAQLDLVPSLNDAPAWAQAVADMVRRH